MAGTWERTGDGQFVLDPQIDVEVYRWHEPGQSGSGFVEFQSPKEFPHRRFYPSEVLAALKRGEPADDYAERMCRLGISLLPELDSGFRAWVIATTGSDEGYAGKEMPAPEVLAFWLALFEGRREGHQRVARGFHREDDFYATEGSRKKDDFLVPGVEPPRQSSKARLKGQDVIRHIAKSLPDSPAPAGNQVEVELPLFQSPLRTPLDQVLVEGVFRKGDAAKALTITDVARRIAPALIDSIDLDNDSRFIAEHHDDFDHFFRRLVQKHVNEPDRFRSWLRQERGKGFVRLLPGFKGFSPVDREAAHDKGKRFFRYVLWTSYEAMSRAFGATALHLWVSFCQSDVIRPSTDEQRAFRYYHAPLVLAAGMPLWFFGPNVLRWVMDDFIDKVWGWKEGQDFDSLTTLIALYGETARLRRQVDARKKRMKQVAQNRPDLLGKAVQSEETRDGQVVAKRVRTVAPVEFLDDAEADCPDFPSSRACRCGGKLERLGRGTPKLTKSWMVVETRCARCGRRQAYRIRRPGEAVIDSTPTGDHGIT